MGTNPLIQLKGRKRVKNLKACLKDCEVLMKTPVKAGEKIRHRLWQNDKLENFSLSFREIWSLLLLCIVINEVDGADFTFCDGEDGDGVIVDNRSGEVTPVENVSALDFPNTSLLRGEERIIQRIMEKASKGKEYASGKILIVFYDGAHRAEPNKVAKSVAGKHHFDQIYLVGLIDDKGGTEYTYSVYRLNEKDAQISVIRINPDFSGWQLLDPRAFLS